MSMVLLQFIFAALAAGFFYFRRTNHPSAIVAIAA